MTRDEAEETLREKTANGCSLSDIRNFLDMATALGLVKLDEPEESGDTRDKAVAAFWSIRGPVSACALFEALDKAGLKIVEK